MSAHDAQNGGEAEAASDELGGKEGIEHLRLRGLIHSLTRIAHFEQHVLSGRQVSAGKTSPIVVGGEVAHGGGDRDGARLDRFVRILDQIHHHLLDLAGVGVDAGEGRIEVEPQANGLS